MNKGIEAAAMPTDFRMLHFILLPLLIYCFY
jgi:hypothetical protein